MRRGFAIVLAAVMTCQAVSAAPVFAASSAETAASDMKVAMITDYGDITDMSFNQTTYEAGKSFCEQNGLDFTYYKPEGDSTADRSAMIDKAAADGYNVILMPGYAFAEAIVDEADMYPDVKFIALDVSQGDLDDASGEDGYSRDNVYSAVYQEELPGYMAGYAAVKMGYQKLGFLGGMAVPAVIRYGYGYVQGADDAAKELGESGVEVNYAYGNQFFGDADITAAMDTWYSGGTQVVFACGGGIYTSACEAAEKGLAATVNTLLGAVRDGKWGDYKGKVENLGLVSGDDMSLNYVGLPEDSTVFTDTFTDDDYKALVKDLYDGKIKVESDTTAEEPAAENITVNFQGNPK